MSQSREYALVQKKGSRVGRYVKSVVAEVDKILKEKLIRFTSKWFLKGEKFKLSFIIRSTSATEKVITGETHKIEFGEEAIYEEFRRDCAKISVSFGSNHQKGSR